MRFYADYRRFLVVAVAVVVCVDAAASERYLRQVKPLLEERCWACHGALKQEAGLRLDSAELIRNAGAVIPEDVDGSSLIDRIESDDPDYRMPPIGKPLTADEIDAIRAWIADGARAPADEQPETDPARHWAFLPIERPELPRAIAAGGAATPIDHLLQIGWQRHGVQPARAAEPSELLRRVYLDLIGLPPSPEQIEAFCRDPSERAWRETVDRLLDSPLYGQRWGRHWMDVWRYSDWYGRRQQNDVRNSAPQIWRWRDWIVDSLNEDKSYARMIEEMLAADEIAPEDDSTWPATGYLIRNYYSLNPNEWMRHNVEYTAKAFLGLTINCAHCHDHKYDPIAQEDYFRLRACFEPLGVRQDRVLGQPEPPPFQPYTYAGSRKVIREGMVRVYDEAPDATTWFYTGGDERNRVEERGSIAPGVPEFLGIPLDIQPIDLPMTGWYPGSRPHIQQATLHQRQEAVRDAELQWAAVGETEIDTAKLEDAVGLAQRELDEALAAAIAKGESPTLAGRQSLLLDASAGGRRILQHDLQELKAIPESTKISFRLRILADNHFNFQLARDSSKHLTALYVGFVAGQIKAYRPGGFSEFVVGKYDFAGGQSDFFVRLVVMPKDDHAFLSVGSREDAADLVADVPIALNGWNTVANPHQPMTFDCRTATRVLIDEVSVVAGDQSLRWGFEPPTFSDAGDVDGIEGWRVHTASSGSARSEVSSVAACESVRPQWTTLKNAETSLRDATVVHDAAAQRLRKSQLELTSTAAVIAADNASRVGVDAAELSRLADTAGKAQATADLADARFRVLDARAKRRAATELPDDEKSKAGLLKEADQVLAAAEKNLKQIESGPQDAAETDSSYRRLSPTSSPTSTGRRAALARWITDRRNPLTARVAVNHIWMRHFHAPLVESVDDFGRNGKPPLHPDVLDWLASELLESNGSIKHIHRQILCSHAYRMSVSEGDAETNRRVDEDNRLLWKMNTGRLEAEIVRDNILLIAGKLDTSLGGPPRPNTESLTTFRRSLYYESSRRMVGAGRWQRYLIRPIRPSVFAARRRSCHSRRWR